MARLFALSMIALSLALAGCTGSDDEAPVEAADTDAPATSGGAPSADSGADAGIGGAAAGEGAADAGAAARSVPVSYSGSLDAGADVCQVGSSGGSCTGTPTSIRDGFDVDLGGGMATSFVLRIATSTAVEEDRFLVELVGCHDDGCESYATSGTGALEISGTASTPWTRVSVHISPPPQGAGDVAIFATAGGTFEIEGAVEVVG